MSYHVINHVVQYHSVTQVAMIDAFWHACKFESLLSPNRDYNMSLCPLYWANCTWILWGNHTCIFVNPSFPVEGQCIDFWLKMKRAATAAFRAFVVLNFYLWGFVLNIINSIGYQLCFCLSRNFIWHFVVGRLPINACACIRIRTTSLPSSTVTLRGGLAESALARLLKRKRKADIIRRRRSWGGGSGAGGGIAHQGGQARHLYTPRTWEPNPDSSGDEAEVVYPEPRRSLSDLGSVNLVPQSALYQPVRSVGLVPEARGSSDPYGKGKSRAVSTSARPIRPILLGHLPLKTASDHNRGRVWWPGSSIIVWRWPVSFLRTSVVQGISFPRASASYLSPLVFVVRILLQQGCIRVWNHICGRLTKPLWSKLSRTSRSCQDLQLCWIGTRCLTPTALRLGALKEWTRTGRFLTGTWLRWLSWATCASNLNAGSIWWFATTLCLLFETWRTWFTLQGKAVFRCNWSWSRLKGRVQRGSLQHFVQWSAGSSVCSTTT